MELFRAEESAVSSLLITMYDNEEVVPPLLLQLIGPATTPLVIHGTWRSDTITLKSPDDLFDAPITIYGQEGRDLINASALSVPVMLIGGTGDDTLRGGTADDMLDGGGATTF